MREDELMEEYERIEDLEMAARRRCDFKLAVKYGAMLDEIGYQLFPWTRPAFRDQNGVLVHDGATYTRAEYERMYHDSETD